MKNKNKIFKSLEEFNKKFFPERYKMEKFTQGDVDLNISLPPKLIDKLKKSI